MPVIQKSKGAYSVDIIESECGWGSKLDETIYFDNEAEAKNTSRIIMQSITLH